MVRLELKMETDFNEVAEGQKLIGKLKKALLEVMFSVERHAKRLAPVDTGRLRAGIHVNPKKPSVKITVSDSVEYGVYQEFGTSTMRAQPFMRPARDIALKVDLPRILKKHKLK